MEVGEPRAPEPSRRLESGARGMWAVEALGWAVPLVLLALIGGSSARSAGAPGFVVPGLLAVAVVMGAVGVLVVPALRWRRWRYEVRDEEIDLRHGAFTVTRTLIPVPRLQHVDTRRTVVSQIFRLAVVVIHTAAGRNTIPGLAERDAAAIRDRIAELARTPDEP